MRLSNSISLFFFSVEHYTVESDGSEEEDVVILTADKSSGFQQRYDIFIWCNTDYFLTKSEVFTGVMPYNWRIRARVISATNTSHIINRSNVNQKHIT